MTGFLRTRSPASLPCQCPHSRGRPSIALIQRWSVPGTPNAWRRFVVNSSKFRRSVVAVAALAVIGVTSAVGLQQAQAATTVGGFEIDGDIAAQSALDWSNVGNQPIVSDDHVSNPDETIYTQGSKEDDPDSWAVHSSGKPTPKDDVGYVFGYSHRVNGHEFAYIGFERAAKNGTTQFVVELNQNSDKANSNGVQVPDRIEGDLRLVITQQGNSDFTVSGSVDRFESGAYKSVQPPGGWISGTANHDAITPIDSDDEVLVNGKVPANQFAEVAFDLTAIASTSEGCASGPFSTVNMRSQTSTSKTPELKDFVNPVG